MNGHQSTEDLFKDLFAREYNNLCRYALTYMQDSHLAEDVVQDTFIKIWEQKKDLITSPQVKFYLVTAVKNNCISALRKQNTRAEIFTEEAPESEPEPFITPTQHRQQLSEQQQKIADALNQLPPKCKEVFLMVKMHGMSYKQTADALQLSVKTVENQMGKAIKTLREYTGNLAMIIFFIIFLTSVGVFAAQCVL
jgi:RNA polymerase sigma-70 factor (family 1)